MTSHRGYIILRNLSRITKPMFSADGRSDPMSFFINLLWILGFGGLVTAILGFAGVIGR